MTTAADTDDMRALAAGFAAIEQDARDLLAGLAESTAAWRPRPDAWSVAECLDHLATANRVYLAAMEPAAARALARGRLRRGPARPGIVGRWFVGTLEPPARPLRRSKAPRAIRPRVAPPLGDAARAFFDSHRDVRDWLQRYAGIDLAGVRFPNPFIPGIRFSLATGIHVLAAHERRHLWQAWNVRRSARERQPAA